MNQLKSLFIPKAATFSDLEIPLLAWSSGHSMPQCSNLCNIKMKGRKKDLTKS